MMADPATALVVIVDDEPLMLRALDSLLRSVGLRTRSYGAPREVTDDLPADLPCCFIVDIRMPGMSGLEFHRHLKSRGIERPVIFVTGHGDIPMTVQAMKAGAVDFLVKPFREQELLDAVTTALAKDGERLASSRDRAAKRALYDRLTPRERDVMALVAQGLLNKQVAAELGISEITVKLHRSRLMKKMEVRSLPELVRRADLVLAD